VVQGLTQWRLRWGWRSTMHEGTCRLADLRAPDCVTIGDIAEGRAREITRPYQKRNELYERNTRRG
jgi:hypothetical protein